MQNNNRAFFFDAIVLQNIRGSGFSYWQEVPNIGWVRSRYLPKDGSVSMAGNLNMNNNKIINLGDPTGATDAINKQYLGKSHVKPSH